MSSGGFASTYQPMPREQLLRFINPDREPASEKELRTLLLTRRGAIRMFATGGIELGAMLLVLLGLHQVLIDQPVGLLFLIVPASTVGVMLALWGMLAWSVNVIRAEMADARRERGMILENQAQLIAQNERLIGEQALGRTSGRAAVGMSLPTHDTMRIIRPAAPAGDEPSSPGQSAPPPPDNLVAMPNPRVYQLGIQEGERRARKKGAGEPEE